MYCWSILFFQGVVYPGIHAVWAKWAPPMERTKLGLLGFSGNIVGIAFAYPLCGWLTINYGWPATFYMPGIKIWDLRSYYSREICTINFCFAYLALIAIIWCIIWLTCVAESPVDDKYITKEELKYIIDMIGPTDDNNGID